MSTLTERLQGLQDAWAGTICPWADDPVQPEIIQANRDCKASPGGVVYNSDVARLVIEQYAIPEHLRKVLDAQVYLSQQILRAERKAAELAEYKALGYSAFDFDAFGKMREGSRIEVVFPDGREAKVCRVVRDPSDGEIFVMPGRNRRKGWTAMAVAFANFRAYYREVTT